jgi:Isochorismatase family
MQERLLPVIDGREQLLHNVVRLLKGGTLLGLPAFATEQYRKGLGATVPQVANLIPAFAPFEKESFSGAAQPQLLPALRAKAISDIILCGVETHVCVLQTCLDLLYEEFRTFVVADAVSSRTRQNHQLGLGRMRQAGAVIVSVEMVLLELLGRAGTEEFKQVLTLIK